MLEYWVIELSSLEGKTGFPRLQSYKYKDAATILINRNLTLKSHMKLGLALWHLQSFSKSHPKHYSLNCSFDDKFSARWQVSNGLVNSRDFMQHEFSLNNTSLQPGKGASVSKDLQDMLNSEAIVVNLLTASIKNSLKLPRNDEYGLAEQMASRTAAFSRQESLEPPEPNHTHSGPAISDAKYPDDVSSKKKIYRAASSLETPLRELSEQKDMNKTVPYPDRLKTTIHRPATQEEFEEISGSETRRLMQDRSSVRDSQLHEQVNNLISDEDLVKLKQGLRKMTQSSKDVISLGRFEDAERMRASRERQTVAAQLGNSSDENHNFFRKLKIDGYSVEGASESQGNVLRERCLNIPEEVTFQGPSDFDILANKQVLGKKNPKIPKLFTEKTLGFKDKQKNPEAYQPDGSANNHYSKKRTTEKPSFMSSKRVDTSVDCDLDRNEMIVVNKYPPNFLRVPRQNPPIPHTLSKPSPKPLKPQPNLSNTLPSQLTFANQNNSSSKFELVEVSRNRHPIINSNTENLHIEAYDCLTTAYRPGMAIRHAGPPDDIENEESAGHDEDVDIRDDVFDDDEASEYSEPESLITAKSAKCKPNTKKDVKKPKKKTRSRPVSVKGDVKTQRTSKPNSKKTDKSGRASKSPQQIVCRT